jgi:hypothetical protein
MRIRLILCGEIKRGQPRSDSSGLLILRKLLKTRCAQNAPFSEWGSSMYTGVYTESLKTPFLFFLVRCTMEGQESLTPPNTEYIGADHLLRA